MSSKIVVFTSLLLALMAGVAQADDVVIAEGDIQITRAEFEAELLLAPPKVQARVANDLGDRFEFINGLVQSRKLAAQADKITPQDDGYWDLQFSLLNVKRQFAFQREVGSFTATNIEPLAQEYYLTRKEKFARIPETRASSHILLASQPGLDRAGVRAKAQDLLDKLRAGADFEAMVAEYSDDPGSKGRKGSFDRWIQLGEMDITPPYSGALFEINAVGGYSQITDSPFGIHILRLDGIREAGFEPYANVQVSIINYIIGEFRTLAGKTVSTRYNIGAEAFIDGTAMEALVAPYR